MYIRIYVLYVHLILFLFVDMVVNYESIYVLMFVKVGVSEPMVKKST